MANIGKKQVTITVVEPLPSQLPGGTPAPTFTPREAPAETPIPMEPIKAPERVGVTVKR